MNGAGFVLEKRWKFVIFSSFQFSNILSLVTLSTVRFHFNIVSNDRRNKSVITNYVYIWSNYHNKCHHSVRRSICLQTRWQFAAGTWWQRGRPKCWFNQITITHKKIELTISAPMRHKELYSAFSFSKSQYRDFSNMCTPTITTLKMN